MKSKVYYTHIVMKNVTAVMRSFDMSYMSDMEGMLKKLADKPVRDEVCILIEKAKMFDSEALALMDSMIKKQN